MVPGDCCTQSTRGAYGVLHLKQEEELMHSSVLTGLFSFFRTATCVQTLYM